MRIILINFGWKIVIWTKILEELSKGSNKKLLKYWGYELGD